jgi:hypothetical protein
MSWRIQAEMIELVVIATEMSLLVIVIEVNC